MKKIFVVFINMVKGEVTQAKFGVRNFSYFEGLRNKIVKKILVIT